MQQFDVVIAGAGLAGLSCARDVAAAGFDVLVLEASDAVGGRVRTDLVNGLRMDRGFQLLNPAYPALKSFVDLEALDLRAFGPGVVVTVDGERHVLADPRRSLSDLAAAFDSSTGSVWEKARFASYVGQSAVRSGSSIKARDDVAYGRALDRAGVRGRLRRTVVDTFLAGVLGEDDQSSSRVFVDLLLRTFARGTPALPAGGMQALPDYLAVQLAPGIVRLHEPVRALHENRVSTDSGDIAARAIVVATDPVRAAGLGGLPEPSMRSLTTYYHHVAASPASRPFLHLDGDRSGPVVNSAVVSDVAATYADTGALVASTVLGARDDSETLAAATRQLARMYGTSAESWEHVATYAIPDALVAMPPGSGLRRQVSLGSGLFVCGDHRDTASIQGAIVSGRRTAAAVLRTLS